MTKYSLLESFDLPACLRDRILCRVPPSHSNKVSDHDKTRVGQTGSFVLYLPTVVLRKRHNPGFALACFLANHHKVPLLVLATILDDHHLSRTPLSPITMTSRRLAFTLEALKDSCSEWENHGAGVAIRIHGPGCRTPHHLSLCHSAIGVVSDEPFVEPYRTYVRKIVKTCRSASVPFWTVDGSTSVPPKSKLVAKPSALVSTATLMDGDRSFSGAPSKAWRWEQQTESVRKRHVYGAYRDKALDAPVLECKLRPDFFRNSTTESGDESEKNTSEVSFHTTILPLVPSKWKDLSVPAPGQRAWTVSELLALEDCKTWALAWKGADASVPPCQQTHGAKIAAKRRWSSFVNFKLKDYAKKRNGIIDPHAVSRVSCYLNLGILSIFDVLHDVWQAKEERRGFATGCNKFLEEVVKWREGSYVHAFANPDYHTVGVLPPWARRYLEGLRKNGPTNGYHYQELESASTRDETWNAMQGYLIDTGELHNNARMTWGKTVVHWQASRVSPDEILWQLCCLNDRFALDGLSPPSYGGILWCFGWQDKPASGQKVSEKWASRYRTGAHGFLQAKENLYDETIRTDVRGSIDAHAQSTSGKRHSIATKLSLENPAKKIRSHDEHTTKTSNSKNILSYFSPASKSTK